jgi:hypothetical protein
MPPDGGADGVVDRGGGAGVVVLGGGADEVVVWAGAVVACGDVAVCVVVDGAELVAGCGGTRTVNVLLARVSGLPTTVTTRW